SFLSPLPVDEHTAAAAGVGELPLRRPEIDADQLGMTPRDLLARQLDRAPREPADRDSRATAQRDAAIRARDPRTFPLDEHGVEIAPTCALRQGVGAGETHPQATFRTFDPALALRRAERAPTLTLYR